MDAGVWVGVSELARIKGVRHSAVSKRLDRLEREGLVTTRRERGRRMVNLAEWDTVTQEVSDPAKLAGRDTVRVREGRAPVDDGVPAVAAPATSNKAVAVEDGHPVYTREQARKAQYDAELRRLELERQLGRLVAVDDVQRTATRIAERLVRALDQLPSSADDVMTAVSRGGVVEVRRVLRSRATEIRQIMADELSGLAGDDGGQVDTATAAEDAPVEAAQDVPDGSADA